MGLLFGTTLGCSRLPMQCCRRRTLLSNFPRSRLRYCRTVGRKCLDSTPCCLRACMCDYRRSLYNPPCSHLPICHSHRRKPQCTFRLDPTRHYRKGQCRCLDFARCCRCEYKHDCLLPSTFPCSRPPTPGCRRRTSRRNFLLCPTRHFHKEQHLDIVF